MLPDFHDIRHVKVVKLSASLTGRLYSMKCSWYSFSLGAESTPGPWNGRKEYVIEKSFNVSLIYFYFPSFVVMYSKYWILLKNMMSLICIAFE